MRNIEFVLIDSLKTYEQHKDDSRKVGATLASIIHKN